MELWKVNSKLYYKKSEKTRREIKLFVKSLLETEYAEYDLPFVDSSDNIWDCYVFHNSRLMNSADIGHTVILKVMHRETGICYSLDIASDVDKEISLYIEYFMGKLFSRRCLVL